MLDQIKLNDKTYNEIFQKAIATIPILSNEWTDYNYSDPGINTLQIISIVKLFQQSYVDKVRQDVKYNLIKLLGYNVEDVIPSQTYVEIHNHNECKLYCNQKMTAGDIVFEICESENISNSNIRNVVLYDHFRDTYIDITRFFVNNTKTSIYVFGENADIESAIYIFFDKPIFVGNCYNLYVEIEKLPYKNRNHIPDNVDFRLCEIIWQIFSDNDWHDIKVKDATKGFLQNGIIQLLIDKDMSEMCLKDIGQGYVIRGILKKSYYDLPPKINRIHFNVCEVKQIDTLAKSFVFDSNGNIVQIYIIENFITAYNNIIILVKDNGNIYHKYYDTDDMQNKNCCKVYNDFNGYLKIVFDKDKYGVSPPKGRDVIKIICHSDYFIKYKIDTKMYGFENQIIQLDDRMKYIVADKFGIMIKVKDYTDEEYFYDVDNSCSEIGLVKYKLDNIKNQIEILETNIIGDINIIITDCVLSKGRHGNIRENEINDIAILSNDNKMMDKFSVRNLYPSSGGDDIETIDKIILKIMNDIYSTHSLVTRQDFENKVFEVPGVIIHKVKAVNEIDESNRVDIIVKPYSIEPFPVVNDIYKKTILNYLNKYRLITTQIDILSPVYVPIDVTGNIYIRPNYKDADIIIKNFIANELDAINSDKDFGCEIIYGDLYSKIESLSCVDAIYSLSIESASKYAKKLINSNIILNKNALSYLGNYDIEISNNIVVM